MSHHFFWPNVANDVINTVEYCMSYAQEGSKMKDKHKVQLFQAPWPPAFLFNRYIKPIPKTLSANQDLVPMPDCSSKPYRCHFQHKIHGPAFCIHIAWQLDATIRYSKLGIEWKQPTVSQQMFDDAATFLQLKELTIIAYHQQTNDRVKRYNHTAVPRFRHYESRHHGYWDTYVQPLTYAHSSQDRRHADT